MSIALVHSSANTLPYMAPLRTHSATEVMSPSLDPIAWRFAAYARNSRLSVLDVGCGDGIASAAALARGAYVVAVDHDRHALTQLLARVPAEQYARLTLKLQSIENLDFSVPQFAALHAGRVLHAIGPVALRKSLRNFSRWLYPNGKLFLSTYTPEGRAWEPFRPVYEERVANCEVWPGFIAEISEHFPYWGDGESSIHLLDEQVLSRELAEAGFVIESSHHHRLPWDSELTCCGIIARCEQDM